MKCKLSEKCEFGNLCKDATRHDSLTVLGCSSFKTKKPMTEQEYIQTCNAEQLAEAIYYLTWFHTELDERLDKNVKNGCYNDDENIKIVTEWLKQPHTPKE